MTDEIVYLTSYEVGPAVANCVPPGQGARWLVVERGDQKQVIQFALPRKVI